MPRPSHFELQAQEPERAIAFYRDLFGWNFEPFGPPGAYWLIKTGDEEPGIDGGLMPRRGPAPSGDEPMTAAVLACTIDDVDSYVKRAVAAGGAIAVPKQEIEGAGSVAYVKDTEGNVVGLWQRSA